MDLQRIEFLMYQLGRAVGALRASHDNACNMVGLEIEEAIKERTTPKVEQYWRDIQRATGINEHHLGGAGIARQATQANYSVYDKITGESFLAE